MKRLPHAAWTALLALACSFDTSGVGPSIADGNDVAPDGGKSMLELVGCPIFLEDTQVGEQSSGTFTVQNAGSASTRVNSVALTDIMGGTFSLNIKNSLPTVLQPKETFDVRVRLTPQDSQADSANVEISTDEAGGTSIFCAVEGSPAICVPTDTSDATCDGFDDDCDGTIDDDYESPGSCSVGLCPSVWVCDNGDEVCPVNPVTEICNAQDDDCDGDVDEDFMVGAACDNGEQGICYQTGVYICDGGLQVCDAPVVTPILETCNALDDNCDGSTDEGCIDADDDDYCAPGSPAVTASNSICSSSGVDCNDADSTINPGANELLTCGNCIDNDCDGTPFNDGCNQWMPAGTGGDGPPTPRHEHSMVWTGSEALIWGGTPTPGVNNTGARYDPATGIWTAISQVGAPPGRSAHTAVWTGSKMIVWAGWTGPFSCVNSGGRYDPVSSSWEPMSEPSFSNGGYTNAVWTGSEMIFWGGWVCAGYTNVGGRYDPVSNDWVAIPNGTAPSGRGYVTQVWSGSELIVWGGSTDGGLSGAMNDGGRFDVLAGTWTPTSTTGAPSPRFSHVAAWTGSEMIVWGGTDNVGPFGTRRNDGGRYNPTDNTWLPTASADAPAPRESIFFARVWTGNYFVVWGGVGSSSTLNTGGFYDPDAGADGTWTPMSTGGAIPISREPYRIIWTGSQAMIFGGSTTGGLLDPLPLGDGWLYCP